VRLVEPDILGAHVVLPRFGGVDDGSLGGGGGQFLVRLVLVGQPRVLRHRDRLDVADSGRRTPGVAEHAHDRVGCYGEQAVHRPAVTGGVGAAVAVGERLLHGVLDRRVDVAVLGGQPLRPLGGGDGGTVQGSSHQRPEVGDRQVVGAAIDTQPGDV